MIAVRAEVIGNWRLREITTWIPSDEGRKTDRSIRESAWNVIVRSIPFVHSATLPRIKTLISGCTTGYTYSYRLPLPRSSSSPFRFCTVYPLSLRFIPLCCSFLASSLSLPLLSTSYYFSFLLPSSQYSLSLSLWLVLVLESPLGVLQERVPTGETKKMISRHMNANVIFLSLSSVKL